MWLIFVTLVFLFLGTSSIKFALESILLLRELCKDDQKTKKQWKLEE